MELVLKGISTITEAIRLAHQIDIIKFGQLGKQGSSGQRPGQRDQFQMYAATTIIIATVTILVTTIITTIVPTTTISKIKGATIPISIPIRGLQPPPIGIPLDKTFKGYKVSPPTTTIITTITI